MAHGSISVEFLEGHNAPRRGIAWLKIEGNKHVNAQMIFDALPTRDQYYVHTSIDLWLARKPDINSRYHGWPGEPKYKNVQVFKWRDRRVRHRLYGFKIHPCIPDWRLELCVLAMHTIKNEAIADPWYKNQMNKFRDDITIQEVIKKQLQLHFAKNRQTGGGN